MARTGPYNAFIKHFSVLFFYFVLFGEKDNDRIKNLQKYWGQLVVFDDDKISLGEDQMASQNLQQIHQEASAGLRSHRTC